MGGDPYGKPGVARRAHAFLQERCCLADRKDELVFASRRDVDARKEAVGEFRLEIQGFGGVGIGA